MKIVLDTNVFVSGIHWTGDSEKILSAWRDKRFELISSIPIIEEITETLRNFKIYLSSEEISMWKNMILENSLLVEPEEEINIVKDDVSDDKFVEAAVTGKADYIITQDNHLLKIKEFRGIKILTPKEFLDIIKKKEELSYI